jgi:leucyl-tRNA synthetase
MSEARDQFETSDSRAPDFEAYDFRAIEARWRGYWAHTALYQARDDDPRPKYYCLDMFPYPSGSGLHVGHWRSYVLPDAWSRYMLLKGFNVLHPMGWDAFGLPAENDAIKKGMHPAANTRANIANFKRQLVEMSPMYDWSREIDTTEPEYYRWTQWIFVRMFRAGLAYRASMPINWCPSCKTGLANEEVVGGACERCGTDVGKKDMRQWMLRITAYAERLLSGLDALDWPEKVKTMQRNWIGRSEGAEVRFTALDPAGTAHPLPIYTTRPDTLFGATYMVLAPEHPLVEVLTPLDRTDAVRQYAEQARTRREIDRAAATPDKTGLFTGAWAVNPVNGERIPVWVADYVLMGYGTGAIMAVPAHDERDYVFAKKFGLEIREVIASAAGVAAEAWTGDGTMVLSGDFDGLGAEEGRRQVTAWLEDRGLGRGTVNYRLRDWVFSRQRYWGEPIPIIHCPDCGEVAVPEADLPVRLPEVERYEPTGTGESPLAAIEEWVRIDCPECGKPGRRETHTMPQWAGSSWYFLRYASPHEPNALVSEAGKAWLPVDMYVGGVEHAILHLLYARFFTMFLYDIGVVGFEEPFRRLFNQGMITRLGKNGRVEKMSKSKGNVVNPDDLVESHGCDSLRLYELFVGPPEMDAEWNDRGIDGVHRFLKRAWAWVLVHNLAWADAPSARMRSARHVLVRAVTERLDTFRLNTVVSALMEFLNEVQRLGEAPDRETVEAFLVVLSPFAPHFAEELWERTGHAPSVFRQAWPTWDEAATTSGTVTLAVQVNGKVRGTLDVVPDAPEDEVVSASRRDAAIARHLDGKTVRKVIYVPGKILNLVVG